MSGLRALRQRIRDAFAETPPPIGPGHAQRLFAGRRWKDVRGERVDAASEELALFTYEEFRYYLPAYLLRALDAVDAPPSRRGRSADVLEFVIYELMDTTNEMWLAGTYARTRLFSDDERAVIREFLETVRTAWDEAERYHALEIASALRRFG